MNLSLMPGFCKHFCLDFVLFLLPMAGRAGTATSTSKSSSSCQTCWAVCHSEATHNLSDTWTTNLGTTRLKSLSCGCWGSAALALCEQSSICTGIFWALPFFFFFCCLFKLQPKGPWWEPKPTGIIQRVLWFSWKGTKTPREMAASYHHQQNQQGVSPVLPVWLHWKTSKIHCQQECLQLGQSSEKCPCGYLWLWSALK